MFCRLQHTFEALPKESFDLFKKLSAIASESHGTFFSQNIYLSPIFLLYLYLYIL